MMKILMMYRLVDDLETVRPFIHIQPPQGICIHEIAKVLIWVEANDVCSSISHQYMYLVRSTVI